MTSSTAAGAGIDSFPHRLFIDNEWRSAQASGTFAVENPATGEIVAEVADASSTDALTALSAAARASETWAATPPGQRAKILRQSFEQLSRRRNELARLITIEMGKPLAESRGEVAYAADFLRWYADEAVRIDGTYRFAPSGGQRMLTLKQPVGVCLLITPWNFPLAMGTRKIAPALAAGCTMVVKPAEETPLTMLALAQILLECGLPPGVLNVITTSTPAAVVSPLLRDPRVRKLSFTGSTGVGRELIKQGADQILRMSMELGGNAPFVVFDDADLEVAVEGALVAKMRNVGQACTAANRFYVADAVADDFAQRLAKRMADLRVGPGDVDGVEVGPLVSARALKGVVDLVDDAVNRGARVLTGGHATAGAGYFYEPTVLCDVPYGARVQHEEIFGPVAPITSFTAEEDAVKLANDTPYGLAAYVFTRDLARAFRVCERLEVGMVGLNQGMVSNAAAPFGGVKHSGFGREGGTEGIAEYLETKLVAMPV
jgi:succinate-semialdehyde dehydrogenase / glutarate-semialdehyde dehydrogenase